jgi:ABC-type multidrug transport system ATPase subunit
VQIAGASMQTNNTDVVVRAEGLGRRFGRHWALAHFDLEVEAGEAVLLAGPNGSGKTTFLRLAAGLYRPSAGSISILGGDPRADRLTCRSGVTLVSHNAFLYDRMTAREILGFWIARTNSGPGEMDLEGLLAEVGLEGFGDQQVGGFSAGMRKRLTLLRTRIERPRLVLWDEPFSSLDAAGRRLLTDWAEDFRRQGITLVLATHALEVGIGLCERGVVIEDGQMRWKGPAAGVIARMGAEQ